jgi:site-specific DNA-methyltransferase (adenine-specific)
MAMRGTYSRFFLIPKAARSDREPNAYGEYNGDLTPRLRAAYSGGEGEGELTGLNERLRTKTERLNGHPTVKPVELMAHLVRLITPMGGIILDPFLGSGSTAIAAEDEGFEWVGIERDPEYVAIARTRLLGTQRGLGLDVPAPDRRPPARGGPWPERRAPADNYSGGWSGNGDAAEVD